MKRKVVEVFKRAPDIGIHGTHRENIERIMQGKGVFEGHYYFVGVEEKRMNEAEFYNRLRDSVINAIRMSGCELCWRDRKVRVQREPSLIMIVSKMPRALNANSSNRSGLFGETFNVGEDALRDIVDLIPFIVSYKEVEEVGREYEKRIQGKKVWGFGIDASYFAFERLSELLIRRMAKKLERYLQ